MLKDDGLFQNINSALALLRVSVKTKTKIYSRVRHCNVGWKKPLNCQLHYFNKRLEKIYLGVIVRNIF